ncbi:MAG: alginate export family protein [Planctomycetes bacterium]|nr:alginate export family protein [Planctomycetota bacterium]
MRAIRPLQLLTSLAAATAAVAQTGDSPDERGGEIVLPGIQRLTIGGQWRFRAEAFRDYDFDSSRGTNADFLSQRARLKLDFEVNDRIRTVFELQDVRYWGEETATTDDSADGLDFHQAYVEVEETPGIGGTLTVGRQRLSYGDQRLIGALDWLQQGRAFDGVRNRWQCGEGWTDVFATQIRENFANATTTMGHVDRYFGGIYGHYGFAESTTAEPYLLFSHDDGIGAGQSEARGTLGFLVQHDVTDGFSLGGEYATQFGERGAADIPIFECFAVNLHARATTGDAGPWCGIELDYASGDDPNSGADERFDNLFPTAHKFWGYMDLATWSNLAHAAVTAGCRCGDSGSVEVQLHAFRTVERTDALTGPRGTLTAGGAGNSNAMGEEFDLVYTHVVETGGKAKLRLQLGYGVFVPDAGVRGALGGDDPAHFAYFETGLSF